VREPNRREAGEDKLNRVQEGGLDITEREVGGPWVFAYFGTDVDQRESAIRVDVDGVMGVGTEGCDKEGGGSMVEVLDPWDGSEELTTNKFFRREPNVTTGLIVDCVLVRVVVGREARQGGEEVVEGANVDSWVNFRESGNNG